MTSVGILLAAGTSSRFGSENKLLADLKGSPLVTHTARNLQNVGLDNCVAITSDVATKAALLGMPTVDCDPKNAAQSLSLKLGLTYAKSIGADRALVVLGDMPFVSTDDLLAILALGSDTQCAAATNGYRNMPPVCIPASLFDMAMAISGDQGARELIKNLPPSALLHLPDDALRDIDTREQLQQVSGS